MIPQRRRTNKNSRSHTDDFSCEQLEQRILLSTVEILAAGQTNDESISLEIDGVEVQSWDNLGGNSFTGQFETLSYTTAEMLTADQIRIRFSNDQNDPSVGYDRNVRIDAIVIDGTRYETEGASVFSTGTWLPADGVTPGFRQSEFLHANGYLQYADDPSSGSTVSISARGQEGTEQMQLIVNGEAVALFGVTQSLATYTWQAGRDVTADEIRVRFTNDEWDPANGIDANLIVDHVSIDGTLYETEAPTTLSTGTWVNGGITPGFYETEILHTVGYFEYSEPTVEPGTIGLTLETLAIDESTGTLNVIVFRDGNTDGTSTVDYATADVTTNGNDYGAISGTIVFDPGVTGQQLAIQITDDGDLEDDEIFTISLSNPTGATLGAITTQTVTIQDNDEITAGILFEDSFEGSTSWSTNPFGTDTATTGQWAAGAPSQTSSGGAIMQLGSGHTGSRALVTALPAGSSVGTYDIDNGVTSVLSPEIALPAGAEIRLSLEYVLAHLDNASDDDFFQVAIVANGVETQLFDERGDNSVRAAEWQTAEFDISQFGGQTVQILFEAADAQGPSLVEAAVDDVVVEVLPNLPGTFNIANPGINLDESAGSATFTVSRSSGRLGAVSVDYATSPGTAGSGDFTGVSGTLNFADGQSEATVSIPIIDDTLDEDLESFSFSLSNPTGGAVLGTDTVGSVTIADNDNTVGDYLPDLTPIASTLGERLSIDRNEIPGRTLMRFSTEVANAGDGPLEIWGGSTSGNSQQVFQRIYQEGGDSRDTLAGEFVYHPGHGHIHFEGFATYHLLNSNGNVVASGGKTSFCLINIRQPFPGVTANADVVHGRGGNSCGSIQGISAGYSDVYSASLDDQWIDVTNVPDGTYTLEIITDPDNNIEELDETNNRTSITVRLQNGTVTAL